MSTVTEKNIVRMVAIRLGPDEDLLKGIISACKEYNIKDVVVLSCIGSLKHVNIYNSVPLGVEGDQIIYGYAPAPQVWGDLQGVMELCSAKGVLHLNDAGEAEGDLFITFSNAAGTVMGGKLAEGTLVKLTNEIVLGELA